MPLRLIPDLHRATHQVGLYLARLTKLGVDQGEAHILSHLAGSGDCTIAELHRALAHRRSTLTSILDRLAERKLLTREVSARDRRMFTVRLTAHGKLLAAKVFQALEAVEKRVVRRAIRADLQGFSRTVQALEKTAREMSSPGKK
ncbi:MAG TPA: MarR family transcriptional regulator [Candidatus Acidoferrales bacterium]|nr:MarR family transcriptional regulator [Candidatus Acidoferrales bacterium]